MATRYSAQAQASATNSGPSSAQHHGSAQYQDLRAAASSTDPGYQCPRYQRALNIRNDRASPTAKQACEINAAAASQPGSPGTREKTPIRATKPFVYSVYSIWCPDRTLRVLFPVHLRQDSHRGRMPIPSRVLRLPPLSHCPGMRCVLRGARGVPRGEASA